MTLFETFLHFTEGDLHGFRGIVQKIVQSVESFDQMIPFLNKTILAVVGIVVCAAVGVLGYRLLKFVSGFLAAYVGYTAGIYLTVFLAKKISGFPKNAAVEIAISAVFGLALFFLAFKQHKFFAALVAGIVAYDLFIVYVGNVVFLAVGAALIVALLFMYFEKVFTILSLSFCGASLSVAFLSTLLPNVKQLYLYSVDGVAQPGKSGILIAFAIGLVFTIIQFLTNRYFDHDDNYRFSYYY